MIRTIQKNNNTKHEGSQRSKKQVLDDIVFVIKGMEESMEKQFKKQVEYLRLLIKEAKELND